MGIGKVLGSISPAYGMITGKGAMADIARHGGFGVLGKMVTPDKKKGGDDEVRRRGMMGARGMAEDIARRAGVTGEDRTTMKKGGKVKKMAKGGSSASKRADGCATKGKTRGRFV